MSDLSTKHPHDFWGANARALARREARLKLAKARIKAKLAVNRMKRGEKKVVDAFGVTVDD